MKGIKVFLITGLVCLGVTASNAQHPDRYTPVDVTLTLKNMHLWRGLEVTADAMAMADLYYVNPAATLRAGLWGGAAFSGDYKEFDYFVSYSERGFLVEVWDIYNFSPGAAYNNRQAFNYSAAGTGHFIDLTVGYRLQGSVPLGISWSTIFFGRDRGEFNDQNLYSTYVKGDYPVLRHRVVNVDLQVAGAFALNPESGSKANFYAKNAGIVEVSATAHKDIVIAGYTFPVSVLGLWNPANNYANLQVAVRIF